MFRHVSHQTASALVITMGLLVVILSMIYVTSDRVNALNKISRVDFAEQQAAAAAEAVTSFRETYLAQVAAENDLERLAVNPRTEAINDPFEGVDWFGDCLVRWRVEPARVASSDGRYITNPFLYGVSAALLSDPNFVENHEYYHFRIMAESHYLSNPNLVRDRSIAELETDGDLPWQNPMNSISTVRATRVVQLKLNSLFKYALFHAKEGPLGDIEIGPGQGQNITGRVHSNGAIYISGGGMGTSQKSGWGAALIGDASDPVDMVGINGIFRLRKDSLLLCHRTAGDTFYVDPSNATWGDKVRYGDGQSDPLPTDAPFEVTVGSKLDDKQTNPNHTLNGVSLKWWNDSRSPEDMTETFGAYLRDSANSGATVVQTLSNIPQLGGRPFEAQRLIPEGTPLWTLDPSNPNDYSKWTILPNLAFRPADYYVDPDGIDADSTNDFAFTDEPGSNSIAVNQYAVKLYHVAPPRERQFVSSSYPSGTNPVIVVDVDEDGDGILDNSGVAYEADWIVDAGGLRQWYQRDALGNGIHYLDGTNTSDAAKDIIDIFDPNGLWDGNPKPLGPSDALSATKMVPGDAGFRYNGPPVQDADGDSFGDNEVLGTYLDWAMYSKNDADNAGLYGLVIRERRYQNIPDVGSGDEWAGMPDMPSMGSGASTYNARVTMRKTSGSTYYSTDRVRFTRISDSQIVNVDNDDAGYSEVSGSFSNGTSGTYSPYNGDYRYGNSSTAEAQFNANLLGEYTVEIYFAGNTSRGNVEYIVSGNDASGTPFTGATYATTQYRSPSNGYWITLPGTYTFGVAASTPSSDYVNYLKSQYVVYFGENDVTDLFFNYNAASATTASDLVVNENWVLDRREAVFMQYQYWNQDSAFGSTYWRDYKVNMLTFNMRATLDFLMNTDYGLVTTGTATGEMLTNKFNGMIYAHRTRRSDSYTPWDTTRWHPDCYGIWKTSGSVNWSLPPSGQRPWMDLPSSVSPAQGFDWRTGSGPEMTYHSAIRLTNASDLDYGIYYVADKSTADTSDDYYTKKGLTFITPNMCYVWGDYNTIKYADSDSAAVLGTRIDMSDSRWNTDDTFKHVPAAVFADYINILSNDWDDAAQTYNNRTYVSGDTWMMTSVITNNIPSHVDGNGYVHSSEGSHNLIRYNEGWGSRTFHLKGSNVVMNTRRYSRSHIAYKNETPNLNTDVYDPPNRDFQMNSDLFEKPGQPPFTPYGVTVTRTVSAVDVLSK